MLVQDKDLKTESAEEMKTVTKKTPTDQEIRDMIFANKIVKHSKSNSIVLAKNGQLCASGVGQTSRVDALKQAFEKAGVFKFDLTGAVMASDAFFPFSDNIERAHKSGVKYIAQPGGSVRDDAVIECCNKYEMVMAFTGIRLFHH